MRRNLREKFNNFIKNIEKANNKQFGNERLDCCGLNSTKNQIKTQERRVKDDK